jgi:hypothetical protein
VGESLVTSGDPAAAVAALRNAGRTAGRTDYGPLDAGR